MNRSFLGYITSTSSPKKALKNPSDENNDPLTLK